MQQPARPLGLAEFSSVYMLESEFEKLIEPFLNHVIEEAISGNLFPVAGDCSPTAKKATTYAATSPRRPAEKAAATFVHEESSRRNIPTAEFEPSMRPEEQRPARLPYERRDPDLDPQIIWPGKYRATIWMPSSH